MRAFYVEADWAPKPGYKMSTREAETKRALRGNSIFKNMRASVTDRPDPKPKEDEVLLKVGAAGICGTDVHLLRMDDDNYTRYDGHSRYPIITGHEFAGTVVEVGKKVTSLKVGDMVSVESMHWCGECDACRLGMMNQCQNLDEPGLTFDGGFAEYAAIKAKHCYLLNDIRDFYGDDMAALELGAMIEPVGVAYNGMFVSGKGIRPGGHVVIYGAGPIGLSAVAAMRTSGCAKLICFEPNPERAKLAKELGADYLIDPNELKKNGQNASEVLMDLTKGRGVAMFVDCSGITEFTYPTAQGALAIGGKFIQIGHHLGPTTFDQYAFQVKAASIHGSMGQSGMGIYPDVIALMASGRIDMRKAITGRYNLEDTRVGFDAFAKGAPGKMLISPSYPRQ